MKINNSRLIATIFITVVLLATTSFSVFWAKFDNIILLNKLRTGQVVSQEAQEVNCENVIKVRIFARYNFITNEPRNSRELLGNCETSEDFLLWIDKGILEWNDNLLEEAEVSWQTAIRLYPDSFKYFDVLTRSSDQFYSLPNTKNLWESLGRLSTVAAKYAKNDRTMYLWIRRIFTEKLSDPKMGVYWLTVARNNLGDDWLLTWYTYADNLALNDLPAAEQALQEAEIIDFNYRHRSRDEYLFRTGSLKLRQKQFQEAVNFYRLCLAENSQNKDCVYELAESLFQLKNYSESYKLFSELLMENSLSHEKRIFVEDRVNDLIEAGMVQP